MGEVDWRALEALESAELRTFFTGADASLLAELGASVREVGDALVSVVGVGGSVVLNRAIGLGTGQPVTVETVKAIQAVFTDAGVTDYFVHVAPQVQPDDVAQLLSSCGLVKRRGWMKFLRDVSPPPEVETTLSVRAVGPDHAADFARIAGSAFGLADSLRPLLEATVVAEGFHPFMSFDGDTPAGTGALFVHGGLGMLDFGATAPDFRRRGGQAAVLARRIEAARELGVRTLVTTTGEAVPGEEQHSYRNIERMGFAAAYVRDNWGPPPR